MIRYRTEAVVIEGEDVMCHSRISRILGTALLALGFLPAAFAQTPGYGFTVMVPIVAQTGSYQSSVYLHNAMTYAVTLSVTYSGATGSATPGQLSCPSVMVPGNTVVGTSLAALCPSLNAGSNFGALLFDGGTHAAYTRSQTPAGNGFSVEGISEFGYCGSDIRSVLGLTRQAAPPTYQSNCFVWNREARPARVVITLLHGDGTWIADDILELGANEQIRMLDVFAVLGAPPGDYANVRVTFESIVPIGGGTPASVVSFCTVQNNTTFDADFRIGKCHYF
jgi:hypothetical protein